MGKRSTGKRERRARIPETPQATLKREIPSWVFWTIPVAAVIAVALFAYFGFRSLPEEPKFDIPDPDLSGMPAPVVRAMTAARDGVVSQPLSDRTWGHLGAVCDAHALYDCAAEAYRNAHLISPKQFQWVYLLAVVQDFRGADGDDIAALFEKAIDLNPAYPPAAYRYGDALVRLGRLEEAREAYDRAVALDPDFAHAHRGLGQVHLSLDEAEEAVEHLERAAELMPDDAIIFTTLARAYQLRDEPERAEEAAGRAAELNPRLSTPDPVRFDVEKLAVSAPACMRRVRTALQQQNWASAIPDLELLVEMFPDSAVYPQQLGTCYQNLGQHGRAAGYFERAVELGGDPVEANVRLAQLMESQGRFADAAGFYQRALMESPEDAGLHAKLAFALAVNGDLAAAINEFELSAKMAPPDAEIHHNWGTALMRSGNPAEAAKHFRLAIELNPLSAGTHFNLGIVSEQLDLTEDAIAHYRRAIEIDPASPAAQNLAKLEGN
ncbi:MAG: tetratricopeptide repeat protein [Acidobacteriota bacterium]|nr:tetratricopeptide repeat protein [Acidobacteriota bacterium]